MMNARQYTIRSALAAFAVAAVVVVFNYLVDPYGITGAPRISGFNHFKADINDYARQYKKYQPLQREYDTLVLGNSRAEMGIDPQHACFIESDMDVYNLAMPGAGVRMQLNYALNLMYEKPVKRVFLSVDFIDFIDTETPHIQREPLVAQATGELKFLPSGQSNPDYLLAKTKDYARALFSLDALSSSVKTMLRQGGAVPDRTEDGFNPAADLAEIVRVEGARALYDQKMQNLSRKYSQRWYLRDESGSLHPAFSDIEAFLEIARQRDVDVYFFTHPFHTSYWELLARSGLMSAHQQWLEEIVSLAKHYQPATRGFWNFSEDMTYSTERFPEAGGRNDALQWFWEPAHYRRELGDKMVASILAADCSKPGNFGSRAF